MDSNLVKSVLFTSTRVLTLGLTNLDVCHYIDQP